MGDFCVAGMNSMPWREQMDPKEEPSRAEGHAIDIIPI